MKKPTATAFTFEEKRKKCQKEYQEKALVQVQHETCDVFYRYVYTVPEKQD